MGFLVLAVSASALAGFYLLGVWFLAAGAGLFYACALVAWYRRRRYR